MRHAPMLSIAAREWASLDFIEPKNLLCDLADLSTLVASSGLPEKERRLRTNELKPLRELRDAAIFSYGLGIHAGHEIKFAPYENGDHDFVLRWNDGDSDLDTVCPVQLKELVPEDLNPTQSLPQLLETIGVRYPDSRNTLFAIRINRSGPFFPPHFKIPDLHIGALYLYGATKMSGEEWFLRGDFMDNPGQTIFEYPS